MTSAARLPAPVLFVTSGLAQYYGAALAVGLFVLMPPQTVAWLRTAVAAVVLILWRRPWRARWTWRRFAITAAFGLVLMAMNVTFYFGINHIPLGTAVAIEFIGPIAVAAATGRGARQRIALVLAAVGVLLISGWGLEWKDDTVFGLVMILLAGTAWAGYILLGQQMAKGGRAEGEPDGLTALGVGMLVAIVVIAPWAAPHAGPAFGSFWTLVAALGVGVFSSAIPYAIEQIIMRRLTAASFALLLALLPATATIIGLVALRQVPNLAELGGLLCVSAAVALASQRSAAPVRRRRRSDDSGPAAEDTHD